MVFSLPAFQSLLEGEYPQCFMLQLKKQVQRDWFTQVHGAVNDGETIRMQDFDNGLML